MPTFTPGKATLTLKGGQPQYSARLPGGRFYAGIAVEPLIDNGLGGTIFTDEITQGVDIETGLAFATYAEALDTAVQHAGISMAMSRGGNNWANKQANAEDAQATTDTSARTRAMPVHLNVAGGQSPNGNLVDSNGAAFGANINIDIEPESIPNNNNVLRPYVGTLMFAADERGYHDSLQLPTGASSKTRVHDQGARNQLWFGQVSTASAVAGLVDDFQICLGFAVYNDITGVLKQMCFTYRNQHGVSPTVIDATVHNDKFMALLDDTWEITDIDMNQVVITAGGGAPNRRGTIMMTDLGETEADLQIINAPNSAASDWTVTGFDVEPQYAVIAGSTNTSVGTRQGVSGAFIGAFSTCLRQFATSWSGEDGANTSSEASRFSSGFMDLHQNGWQSGAGPTDLYKAGFTGESNFTLDGFRIDEVDIEAASATTHKWVCLVLGNLAAHCRVPRTGRLEIDGFAPTPTVTEEEEEEEEEARPPVSVPPGGGGLLGPGVAIAELIARQCEPGCTAPVNSPGQADQITMGPRARPLTEIVNDGKSNALGRFTLAAGQVTTAVTDRRVGVNSVMSFMPTSANAAAEWGGGTMYVSNRDKYEFTITHANAGTTDRTFEYFIEG